jgi:hypothetical protein
MVATGMNGLVVGDLALVTEQIGTHGPLCVFWRGKSNERHSGKALWPYFATLLELARQRRTQIELHLGAVEFVNSSTLSTIVRLIRESRNASVKLVLVYDGGRSWQCMTFDPLGVFVEDDGLFELRAM